MEQITFGIKQNLNFSTYGLGTISLKNPEFNYNGNILTVDGEVNFEDFDRVVNNKIFNFDLDFTNPLKGGNILIVSKPISLKCGLHPSICAEIFDSNYDEEFLRKLVKEYINTDEEFLLSENWCVFTLSQRKGEKLIGHETLWNTIDYSTPNLVDNWEAITARAAMPFVSKNEDLYNRIKEEQGEAEDGLDFEEFKQFQNFLTAGDNPLSKMLSKITEGDEDLDLDSIIGEMSNLIGDFGGLEDYDEEEDDYEEDEQVLISDAILFYLESEGLKYSYDEENEQFNVEFLVADKIYNGKIIQNQDYYLTVSLQYPQAINIKRDTFLYSFMNVVNSEDLVVKMYFDEKNKSIFVRTSLILTFDVDESERIEDIIDANLHACFNIFPILQSLINGTINLDKACEDYKNTLIGEDSFDDDFEIGFTDF